jgi:tRNA-dihydrouridine synthase 1
MAYTLAALAEFLAQPEPYRCASCPYCNGTRDARPRTAKPEPWAWWREKLGAPRLVVAPMVDQSELPFRMLCRKYGATLAYTPMFHAHNFATSAEYRRREFSTCAADRPLFVQFCGHDADTVLSAARHVEAHCDAVDLNLGCPQGIARKGFYGAFLMEHWDVIHTILHTLSVELAVPVTAKMRVFDDVALTLRYARMLRDSGIHVLAVHGRTREMKGQQTGLADLDQIAAVKREITTIPVIANGNVLRFADIAPNMARTGCDAYMSAEALLWDPRLFADVPDYVMSGRGFVANKAQRLAAIATANEYLALVVGGLTCPSSFVKTHLFKLLHHSLEVHPHLREALGRAGAAAGEAAGTDRGAILDMQRFVGELERLERACDVDVYTRRPKPNAPAEGERDDDAAGAGGAAAAASGMAGARSGSGANALGRRQAADADYASAIGDDAFGALFAPAVPPAKLA